MGSTSSSGVNIHEHQVVCFSLHGVQVAATIKGKELTQHAETLALYVEKLAQVLLQHYAEENKTVSPSWLHDVEVVGEEVWRGGRQCTPSQEGCQAIQNLAKTYFPRPRAEPPGSHFAGAVPRGKLDTEEVMRRFTSTVEVLQEGAREPLSLDFLIEMWRDLERIVASKPKLLNSEGWHELRGLYLRALMGSQEIDVLLPLKEEDSFLPSRADTGTSPRSARLPLSGEISRVGNLTGDPRRGRGASRPLCFDFIE